MWLTWFMKINSTSFRMDQKKIKTRKTAQNMNDMFKLNKNWGNTPSLYYTKQWSAAEAPQALPWICCVEGAGVYRECFQPQHCCENPQRTQPVTHCSYMPKSEENRFENGIAWWVHGWIFCSNTLNVRKHTASGRHSSVCPAVLNTFTKESPFF